jgi:hypothetical protein
LGQFIGQDIPVDDNIQLPHILQSKSVSLTIFSIGVIGMYRTMKRTLRRVAIKRL